MLLLAAGRGRRFGAGTPKVYHLCAGRTLLVRSAERLSRITEEREIILAVHPEDRADLLAPLVPELERAGVSQIVDGGATRQESMQRALDAAAADCDLVLIHDAARPFLPVDATRQAIQRASQCGAACLAVPAPDTLKRVDDQQLVLETVDRRNVWLAQTPQVARREVLAEALRAAMRDGFQGTDDMSLLEQTGATVAVVTGSTRNLKVTTAEDLELASHIAQMEDSG